MTFGLPFFHWEWGGWMHKFVGLLDCNCNPFYHCTLVHNIIIIHYFIMCTASTLTVVKLVLHDKTLQQRKKIK